ncbi:MAG: AAA family ATPase [Thermodesulfobacteriota bacterium]|nr:AAA family ATPase [Thermodesulfobacteriota bacterium]
MDKRTIYIFFGLIASGKSTLAELFAAAHRFPYYNTDRVRKELAGLAANERRPDELGQGLYSLEFTEKTYRVMLERTEQDLQKGAQGVVLDGSYSRRDDRRKVQALAGSKGVDVLFILCACSDKEVKRRLDLRAKDPAAVSDGRWEIFVKQKEKFEFPDELTPDKLLQLDTEAEPEQLLTLLEYFNNDRA